MKSLKCFDLLHFNGGMNTVFHDGGMRSLQQKKIPGQLFTKMTAKFGFSVIGERVFLKDPKKYTFGKSNFKTFFKSWISQILPPFLSTLDT